MLAGLEAHASVGDVGCCGAPGQVKLPEIPPLPLLPCARIATPSKKSIRAKSDCPRKGTISIWIVKKFEGQGGAAMLIQRSSIAIMVLTALGAILFAFAHQRAPKTPAAPPKAEAAPDTQQKGAPEGGGQQQHAEGQHQQQITFTPWTKVCQKPPDPNSQNVCFTGQDGHIDSGKPIVAAVLIEVDGQPEKKLRITLPLGMALQPGTRVIVDDGQPITAPYVVCSPNGCMADYEASQELIDHLEKGKVLGLQGIRGNGQPFGIRLSLAEFAKARDGPPMDEKEFEEQQKKLQLSHVN
jgi:invasion protein IalB